MSTDSVVDLDPTCAAAVDAARQALVDEVQESRVGQHLEAIAEAPLVVTHLFECLDRAYVGWRWAVTTTRVADVEHVTIDEVVLLPGPDSILAPPWLPWSERVQAGDLGAGDVLPTADDDVRLVPGYTGADDPEIDDPLDELHPVLWELGLGRARVLSRIGRDEATRRWQDGETGPRSAVSKAATDTCSTCGFLIPMSGPLGQAFGLCGNEFSPSDGRVTSLDAGCGAHSDSEPEPPAVSVVSLVVDDLSSNNLETDTVPEELPPPIIADIIVI